jgi:hypothetical protein
MRLIAARKSQENDVVSGCGRAASYSRGMTNDARNLPELQNKRRYTWPWFVLAAVLLAIALAVLCDEQGSRARPAHP